MITDLAGKQNGKKRSDHRKTKLSLDLILSVTLTLQPDCCTSYLCRPLLAQTVLLRSFSPRRNANPL
ncbi:hypothetical protein J6590_074033 [Homalodisca vitripennis]|nr:hypothetical protein J6590_074033 [Homalodisca vitripennis]